MPDEVVTPEVTDVATEAEVEVESFETNDDVEVEGAEVETAVDEPSYTITVDGEEIEVSLSELRNGYSRQADYTRKTQELASEREQLASLRRLEAALNEDPAGTLEALRQVFNVGATTVDETEDLDPLEKEVRELRTWRESQEAAAREAAIAAEAASAISKFELADVTADGLLTFAIDNKIGSLDAAARLMRAEQKTAVAAKQTAKTVERKRAAAVVDGGRTRVPEATKPVRYGSLREAYLAAKAQHSA